jgi:hypothetical protein
MKRFLVAALVAAAALGVSGAALATPPAPVTIEVQSIFANGFGTFTTSGAGPCPSGTTTDQVFVSGFQSGNHILFHDRKTFTCSDGSGTFTANLQAFLPFDAPANTFTWNILSGTGAYASLHGRGTGSGEELPNGVDDHFAGSVHFD